MIEWQDNQPIFRQLSDRISEQILQGIWLENQPLPSLRQVAADLKINHLTVMKSYQILVDQEIVEKRRGQGMYVAQGAVMALKTKKKSLFIEQQIPLIADTLKQIDMPLDEFVQQVKQHIAGNQQ
jgi:GntR family transcriptional regulator